MLFPSWISLRFFNKRYRVLAMFQLPQRQAGNLAAVRFLLSVFEPQVSKPLRSARFLNRPHDLKFNDRMFYLSSSPCEGGGWEGVLRANT
ncbi:UNVERIFIED_ORG: hypothetical protein M2414_000653 [Rahnella aquatilis]